MPIPVRIHPISKVLTRDRALATIRAWIVSGTLAPGEAIRDDELAAALGISRSPVRIALIELQYEGLVERSSTGRVSVTALAVDDLERLIPVWMELEVLAARQAAERIATGDGLSIIEATHAEYSAITAWLGTRSDPASDPVDLTRFQAADDRFHEAIVTTSDNRFLVVPLATLRAHHHRYETVCRADDPVLLHDLASDHDAIITAIRGGDPAGAAASMRCHIERAWALGERLRDDRYRWRMSATVSRRERSATRPGLTPVS